MTILKNDYEKQFLFYIYMCIYVYVCVFLWTMLAAHTLKPTAEGKYLFEEPILGIEKTLESK
jgi:hypothetical protein